MDAKPIPNTSRETMVYSQNILLAVRHELIDDSAGQEQPDRKSDEQCPCAVHFDFASHIVKMRLPTKQPMAT